MFPISELVRDSSTSVQNNKIGTNDMKILAAITLVLASSMFAQTPSSAPQKHPFTLEDMMKPSGALAGAIAGWQMGRVRL
jgi:hypothetical protein